MALQVSILRAFDMPFGVAAHSVVRVFQGKAAVKYHQSAALLALGQLLGADQLGKWHDRTPVNKFGKDPTSLQSRK